MSLVPHVYGGQTQNLYVAAPDPRSLFSIEL